ncbi:unnamed protein product [Rotaria sordida]|uniref:Uncharacterized protein n=1 Tax=Rotaria sordida TaxID=392033 RepID=A0A815JNB7_9BILA|nr:unnamed protein product [Rotaria sordida]
MNTHGEQVNLVWFDPNLFSEDNTVILNNLLDEFPNIQTLVEEEQFYTLVEGRANRRIVLIISGKKGEEIIPRIHDRSDILTIYVYCGQIAKYKYLETKYSKVQKVINDPDDLLSTIKSEPNLSK